jgi:hypothetical protein
MIDRVTGSAIASTQKIDAPQTIASTQFSAHMVEIVKVASKQLQRRLLEQIFAILKRETPRPLTQQKGSNTNIRPSQITRSRTMHKLARPGTFRSRHSTAVLAPAAHATNPSSSRACRTRAASCASTSAFRTSTTTGTPSASAKAPEGLA